jgi:hypothetical protein
MAEVSTRNILNAMKSLAGVCFLLSLTAYPMDAHAQLSDFDLSCISAESCKTMVGKRVWVKHNAVPVCPTKDARKNCFDAHVNSSLLITGTVPPPPGDFRWLFAVKTQDGKTGYVLQANSHLLTFKDPASVIATQRRLAAQKAEDRRLQDEADAAAIAASPPAPYETACIFAAAERLPRIPGITIVNTQAKPLPPKRSEKAAPYIFWRIIEIEVTAASQKATYKFLCGKGVRTPAAITALSE